MIGPKLLVIRLAPAEFARLDTRASRLSRDTYDYGSELFRRALAIDTRRRLPRTVGRPPRASHGAWRTLTEKAEGVKAAHPRLPYSVIAGQLGVPLRTLRGYRAALRRLLSDPTPPWEAHCSTCQCAEGES